MNVLLSLQKLISQKNEKKTKINQINKKPNLGKNKIQIQKRNNFIVGNNRFMPF